MSRLPRPLFVVPAVLTAVALGVTAVASSTLPASAADVARDITITGEESTALGSTVSQARCDVTGNGIPDLGIGTYATFNFAAGSTGGYVLLDAGNVAAPADIEALDPVRIIDTTKTAMGGLDVRCAGDVNGDGYDDLVIVSQNYAAFIVFGSADFGTVTLDDLGSRGRTVTGSITRAMGVGDVDGDGRDEVGVTDTTGTVTILSADELDPVSTLADAPGTRISGTGIDLVSVVAAGDVNGDGRDDLYVGAASWTVPGAAGFATGAGWVLSDVSRNVEVGAGEVPGFRINGPLRGYDLQGGSAVGIGDINGDGYDDIMMGGDSDAPKSGSALIVLGSDRTDTVSTDPLATDGPAVSSTNADGTVVSRGWWVNGVAADDHFGHAVGAVRMDGWSMLLGGAMDGSPNPEHDGSGYVVALDSRALVAGALPASDSGVINTADLLDQPVEGANLIAGTGSDQRLGRAFADLTVDPSGTAVTFAAGAPALFNWDGVLPSLRIVTLRVAPTATTEPTTPATTPPTTTPGTVVPPTGTGGSATGGPATAPAGVGTDAQGSLAATGLGDGWAGQVPLAGIIAVILGSGALLLARRREANVR